MSELALTSGKLNQATLSSDLLLKCNPEKVKTDALVFCCNL